MSGPPPPPYQEQDPGPPPTYEQQQQQQTYEQPQETQTYNAPTQYDNNNNNNNNNNNMYPDTTEQPTNSGYSEPEDVVATKGTSQSDSTASRWKLGSYEDGDGYFGPRRRRILTHSILLTFFAFLAFDLWFDTKDSPLGDLKKVDKANKTDFEDGWNLHAGGLFFMFIGVVCVLVAQALDWRDVFKENKIANLIIAAVLVLGSFLYWVGGSVVAGSWNDLKGVKGKTARAGVAFGEATFVGLLGVSLALDVSLNLHSKSKRVRIYLIYGSIIAFSSLVLFFSYATIYTKKMKSPDESAYQTTAAGWFFVLVSIIVLFVLEFFLHSHSLMETNGNLIWLASVGFFLFGAFLTTIGYWALTDEKGVDKDAKDAVNAYFVGYSFLVLILAIVVSIDIKLHEFMPFGKVESNSNNTSNTTNTSTDPTMPEP